MFFVCHIRVALIRMRLKITLLLWKKWTGVRMMGGGALALS